MRDLVRRIVTAMVFSLWLGGFTFYAAVVIPIGRRVLGGDVSQGFVTQEVSTRLNLLAALALALLLWDALAGRDLVPRRLRIALVGTWAIMLASLVGLFVLHPKLDAMLDRDARVVLRPDAFYGAHRLYLLVTTVQWAAAVGHFVLVFVAWRSQDRARAVVSPSRA